ncbi:MAG: SpoIID/LytB domain-containing protein [Clostridia bacterium]|nr:SpoIID/LytB domain-containing protein [Clostridia bacterium]
MKKFFVFLLVIFSVLGLSAMSMAKVSVPDEIRIGIYYGSKGASSVTLSSDGGLKIGTLDADGEFELIEKVGKGESITVTKGSSANSVNVSGIGEIGDKNNVPYFMSGKNSSGLYLISINGTKYRGDVEIKRYSDSDMTVINVLSMQEYLYGVVPREIGGNSPIEAVKAQAIIARTYAAKNYNKRSRWGFNLYPTVDDQAYGGYTWENSNSNNAVDETDGMVATYDGELIGGYYFSTSGGYTENSENVWGGTLDYLKAVPDTYEPENLTKKTWKVTLTASEVKSLLASRGINVGDIVDLVPTEFSDVGRVTELKIVGTNGTEYLTKEKTRTYLGLDSQWYTINSDAPQAVEYIAEENTNSTKRNDTKNDRTDIYKNGDDEEEEEEKEKVVKPLLQKLLAIFTPAKEDTTEVQTAYAAKTAKTEFVIQGRGWGHAVGMSQNGAIGMARNDFDCEEIIKWYYSGVKIQK